MISSVRPITKEDSWRCFDEYEGMKVAEAECRLCQAQYLAWVEHPYRKGEYAPDGFFDLSYRSTFNDEPGTEDLPTPDAVHALDRLECGPGDADDIVEIRRVLMRALRGAE